MIYKFYLPLLVSLFSYSALSADIELSTNTSIGGPMGSTLAVPVDTSSGSVVFAASLEGAYALSEAWQISVPFVLVLHQTSTFQINIGPQFNFGDGPLLDQFFANIRPGIRLATGSTAFAVSAVFGKRFQLTESVSYRPWVGLNAVFYTSADLQVQFSPVAFSFEFNDLI